MITKIGLENVRIFDGSGWEFELAPMSVFCGTNSAGKSTLFKIPLLLRQSQGIRESYGVQSGRLRFVGSQVDLGSYSAFVSHNDITRDMSISLTVLDAMPWPMFKSLRASTTKRKKGSRRSLIKEVYTWQKRFLAD